MSQFYMLNTDQFIKNLNDYNFGEIDFMQSIKSNIFDFIED